MTINGWHLSGTTDCEGFSALPAGVIASETSGEMGSQAALWSSTDGYRMAIQEIGAGPVSVSMEMGEGEKDWAYSVRCVKDN